MTKYILANWKSYKTLKMAESWLHEFYQLYKPSPHLKVIIAPPSIYLAHFTDFVKNRDEGGVSLAIQDISPFPLGPYTGAIAAEMVRGMVDFAILGHSERRRYFHETNQSVASKVEEAFAADIKPLVCLDQPYAAAQLAAMDDADLDKILIGYGPVEASGVKAPQSVKEVEKAVAKITPLAPNSPILYGGSINAKNAADYLGISGISGLMVGTASLDVKEFTRICKLAASI